MIAIIIRITKQMLNDKRSLILVLFAPILIMTLSYFVFGESSYVPKIALINVPIPVVEILEAHNLEIIPQTGTMDEMLEAETVDGVIYFESGEIHLKMYELNSIKVSKISKEVLQAIKQIDPSAPALQIEYLYGDSQSNTFDSLGYILLGVASFFFVFLIAGVSFVRERTLGTMERFMLSPIRRSTVVAGFLLGFGLLAVIQSVLVVIFVKYALGLVIAGSLLGVLVIMILLAFVAVALGSLVSTFANNEFQVAQFIPIIIVPQIFLSGMIPIELLPLGIGNLAYLMPVYYACNALNDLMVKGATFVEVIPEVLILSGLIVILFIGNTLLLKKYRTI